MKCTNLSLKRIGVTMTMINCLFTGAAEICKANNFFYTLFNDYTSLWNDVCRLPTKFAMISENIS